MLSVLWLFIGAVAGLCIASVFYPPKQKKSVDTNNACKCRPNSTSSA